MTWVLHVTFRKPLVRIPPGSEESYEEKMMPHCSTIHYSLVNKDKLAVQSQKFWAQTDLIAKKLAASKKCTTAAEITIVI